MANTTVNRRVKITSAAISRANYETNKAVANAATYLAALAWEFLNIASNDIQGAAGKFNSTGSESGGFTEVSYGHKAGSVNLKVHYNEFSEPPPFVEGTYWGLHIFLDTAGNGIPASGKEEFFGFVGLDSVKFTEPQEGIIEIDLTFTKTGWWRDTVAGGA